MLGGEVERGMKYEGIVGVRKNVEISMVIKVWSNVL